MTDDLQEELASLHAFGLLEGTEREEFLAEIARNPELASRAAELKHACTALAYAAPEAMPPESLKARVLASAAAMDSNLAPAGNRQTDELPRIAFFPTWVPWLAAACLGLAALWAERQYAAERNENALLGRQQQASVLALESTKAELAEQQQIAANELGRAQTQLAEAKQQLTESSRQVAELSTKLKDEGDLAHYKIATLASMLGNTPAAVAVAVWDPSRERGVLAVSKLPALASEKDYQLWVIDKQYAAPVSAGVFAVDPVSGEAHIVFKTDKPVNSIAKFAVSLERKGGVAAPQGPIVLISE
jgi:anti-sigma-K factor RskA